MSTMVEITLPSLPGNWAAGQDIVTHRPLSAPLSAYIEPVGRWFEAHANRRRRGRTLSQDEEEQLAMKAEACVDLSRTESNLCSVYMWL
jgi:DnaJ family protein C protein 2